MSGLECGSALVDMEASRVMYREILVHMRDSGRPHHLNDEVLSWLESLKRMDDIYVAHLAALVREEFWARKYRENPRSRNVSSRSRLIHSLLWHEGNAEHFRERLSRAAPYLESYDFWYLMEHALYYKHPHRITAIRADHSRRLSEVREWRLWGEALAAGMAPAQ